MQAPLFVRGGVWLLTAALCVAALAQSSPDDDAPAQDSGVRDVIVVLDDGQRLTGLLVAEDEESITLRIGGVETTLDRQFIERITTLRPAIERYQSMRSIIDDENTDQLILLIDWLRSEGLYEEALQEIDEILQREPQNGRALRLRDLVNRQKELRDRQRDQQNGASPGGREPLPTRRPSSLAFPTISAEDANLLKVYEIDLRNPPRVLIERETIDKLVGQYGGLGMIPADPVNAEAFRGWSGARQLEAMFDVRARDLYPEVQVLDLPESLRAFRDDVQSTWLVNSCATTVCHGGLDSGSFMLFNRTPTAEASALTNLLILERYRTADGRRLLNYDDPDQSLLLQFALSPRISTSPHPDVRGWRPVFTSKTARRYQDAIAWMGKMIRPRPEVPVEYVPPTPQMFERASPAPAPDDPVEPVEQ